MGFNDFFKKVGGWFSKAGKSIYHGAIKPVVQWTGKQIEHVTSKGMDIVHDVVKIPAKTIETGGKLIQSGISTAGGVLHSGIETIGGIFKSPLFLILLAVGGVVLLMVFMRK